MGSLQKDSDRMTPEDLRASVFFYAAMEPGLKQCHQARMAP